MPKRSDGSHTPSNQPNLDRIPDDFRYVKYPKPTKICEALVLGDYKFVFTYDPFMQDDPKKPMVEVMIVLVNHDKDGSAKIMSMCIPLKSFDQALVFFMKHALDAEKMGRGDA